MRRLILALFVGCALFAPASAGAASVEGTVRPIEWAPEVEVCAMTEVCAMPGANGQYRLDGLPEGSVLIEFVPSYRSRLLKQYYRDAEELSKATPVNGPEATGIDADLIEGGAIAGTVTAAEGKPLAEVEVCARSLESVVLKICSETDSLGEYEIHSLPTGLYAVGFWGGGSSAAFEPSSHPPVATTAGLLTAGVDATLTKGGRIAGEVTAAAGGAPLDGITVCLFASSASAAQRCAETGEEGGYVFQGLTSGSYQVGFSLGAAEIAGTGTTAEVGGYVPQFYEGAVTRAQATTIFLPTAATAEGVDAALGTPAVPPSIPALPVSVPIVAAPPAVAAPKPKKTGCRKGYRRKKIKGKIRCVRPVKKDAKKKHRKHKQWTGPAAGRRQEPLTRRRRIPSSSAKAVAVRPAPTPCSPCEPALPPLRTERKAWTPLLDNPLEVRSTWWAAMATSPSAMVAELNGQFRVLLVGKVEAGTTFKTQNARPPACRRRSPTVVRAGARRGRKTTPKKGFEADENPGR